MTRLPRTLLCLVLAFAFCLCFTLGFATCAPPEPETSNKNQMYLMHLFFKHRGVNNASFLGRRYPHFLGAVC